MDKIDAVGATHGEAGPARISINMTIPTQRYSAFQILIRRFGATRLGAWFFARAAHRLDWVYHRLTGNPRTLVSIVSGLPAMFMTTTGARTGQKRTITLVYIRDEEKNGQIAVVASNLGQQRYPGWYYNLKSNPMAWCIIDGHTLTYIAHEAQGEEYDRFWRYSLETYDGYEVYRQRAGRRIPIMVMVPEDGGRSE